MKLARLGKFGSEKPAIVISDTEAVFVDDVVAVVEVEVVVLLLVK